MKFRYLRTNIGQQLRLRALSTNATLPFSWWSIVDVNRRGRRVEVFNPATGYRLDLSPDEIYGFDENHRVLVLKIGLHFFCPNVGYIYPAAGLMSLNGPMRRCRTVALSG